MVSMREKLRLLRRSPKTREKRLLNTFRDGIMCSGTNIFNSIVTVNRGMNVTVRIGAEGRKKKKK